MLKMFVSISENLHWHKPKHLTQGLRVAYLQAQIGWRTPISTSSKEKQTHRIFRLLLLHLEYPDTVNQSVVGHIQRVSRFPLTPIIVSEFWFRGWFEFPMAVQGKFYAKLPMFCPIVPPFHIIGKVLCRRWRCLHRLSD